MYDFMQFIEWTFMLFYTGYLVYIYAAKNTPTYVKITCFISWIFSFGIVIIIPMDVYFSYQFKLKYQYDDGEYQNDEAFQNLQVVWKVYYYVNQVLSWIILPIVYSYESAGEFTIEGKLKKSIIENLWFYAISGVVLGVVLIYYVAYGTLTLEQLFIFLGALSNSVLLLMVVVLLGHGLVSIPKYCYQNRQLDLQLKQYQYKIVIANEEKTKAGQKFENAIRTLYYISQKPSNSQYAQYFQKIFEMIPEDYKDKTYKDNYQQQVTPSNFNMDQILNEYNDINMKKLVNLNLQVKEACIQLKRANTHYESILDSAFETEDLKDNTFNFDFKIRSTLWLQKNKELCGTLLEDLKFLWKIKLKRHWKNIAGIVSTVLSVMVLLCQIASFTDFQSLNLITPIIENQLGFYTTQLLVLVFLVYIMICVYYSLFNLKIFSTLSLYKNQQTDSVALMFGSLNFARASAPICYNFLQILNVDKTAYESVMGPMDIVPFLGEANIYFYPVILVILSIVNLFDIYRYCLSELELEDYNFNDEMDENKLEEGQSILYRCRNDRERKFLNLQTTKFQNMENYNSMNFKLSYSSEIDKLLNRKKEYQKKGVIFQV